MIRGSTVLALGLVLGVTCALVGRQGSEKDQKSQSVLADIEPNVNKALDNKDDTGANDHKESAKHVSDPIFGWFRKGRKRRCRRYRYRRRPCATPRPRPTQKPTQACSSSKPIDIQWDNDWQKRFVFQCPRGHSLISIKSVFRACQHDRLWKLGCGYNEASNEYCHWSHGYANDAKEGINFNCPNNGFLSGIDSVYTNGDRRFKFKCCNEEEFDHSDCHDSHLLNFPGQDFEFSVERNKRFYMTGISSFFVPEKRDRRWKISYCKSQKEQSQDYHEKKDAIAN